ncbi:MAG: VOC family protein [Deltaproteobacteria bacterium]|nr:VOC family protein [Deltaproteobacteria bacterium]
MLGTSYIITLIPIRDPDRARSFYETKLGLRFIDDDGFALVFEAGDRLLQLTTRTATFCPWSSQPTTSRAR